jgi:hypothetical protein
MSAHSCSFTLYVAPPSLFRANPFIRLAKLCQKHCGGSYEIETRENRNDMTERSTVFVTIPGEPARHLGSLEDTEEFLKQYSAMKL